MIGILNSVKKILGIPSSEDHFDADLIIHINTVFGILRQLGVGPSTGYSIVSDDEEWTDYLEDMALLEIVKSYVPMKVRLMFDPPSNASLLNAIDEKISELEWRLNATVDPGEGGSTPSGTMNYEELQNLPKINSVELKGNKSFADLNFNQLDSEDVEDIWNE